MQVRIKSCTAFEGRAAQYTGEDGYPVGYPVPWIVATDHDGGEWWLPNDFRAEYDAEGFGPFPVVRFDLAKAHEIAEQVYGRGFINAEHWVQDDWGDDPMGAWHGRNE